MDHAKLTIRPANCTHEDGLSFAHFMNIAADGGFRILFGPRYERIVANAFVQPNNDLSYACAMFADVEGQVVGMTSGYTAEEYGEFSSQPLKRAAGRSRPRIFVMMALVSPMMRFLHTYDPGDFYLQFLAVDDSFRGQGIGAALLDAMEMRARENGASSYAIDVAARNDTARRLYERQGFVHHARWPRSEAVRPVVLRLTKVLEPDEGIL